MAIALSNLILLLPVACTLAIMLSMTGSTVVRARSDSVRVFVQIIIWLFVLFGLVGLLARTSPLSLLWLIFLLVFLVQLWFWERGLARNILLLVFGVSSSTPSQLNKIVHFLKQEGRGYWRRLGNRFGRVWQASGNWQMAMVHVRLARPVRTRLALVKLGQKYDPTRFQSQVAKVVEEQKLVSQWLGRLLVVSLSFIALFFAGFVYQWQTAPLLENMWGEISKDIKRDLPTSQAWEQIFHWNLTVIVPVVIWIALISLYLVKKFHVLTRHIPIAWLMRGYYRSLAIESIGDGLKVCRDPVRVFEQIAEGMAVPIWSRKMRMAARQVSAGLTLPHALEKSGILRRHEAASLSLCQDADSIAWAMHELGYSLLERTLSRIHRIVQVLSVVLTIFAAIGTATLAIYMYGALARLIESQL